MVRLLKIHIGKNQTGAETLTAILETIPWNGKLVRQVHVLDEYSYVIFYNYDASFGLLEHIYPEIAGVENVKSEELTQAEIAIINEEVLSSLVVNGDYEPLGDEEGGDDEGDDPKEDK